MVALGARTRTDEVDCTALSDETWSIHVVWELRHTTRNLSRLYEIVSTLIYYGFGDVVQRLGLAKALSYAGVDSTFLGPHDDKMDELT